jgi:hypothetical protein
MDLQAAQTAQNEAREAAQLRFQAAQEAAQRQSKIDLQAAQTAQNEAREAAQFRFQAAHEAAQRQSKIDLQAAQTAQNVAREASHAALKKYLNEAIELSRYKLVMQLSTIFARLLSVFVAVFGRRLHRSVVEPEAAI